MANFPSLWGDIKVAEDKIINKPATSTEDGAGANKPEDEGNTVKPEDNVEDGKNTNTKEDDKEVENQENEGDEYEFTEEDVSKAYTILMEEEVLELTDDDEFEESPKGLADAVAATVRNKVQNELSKIPKVVQDFYNHVATGNDPKDFVEKAIKPNWDELDLEDDNNKRAAVVAQQLELGLSQEEAEAEADLIAESGSLDKRAKIAVSVLSKIQKKKDEEKAKQDALILAQKEKEREQEIQEVQDYIDKAEEIAGFKIDDAKKKGFKDYLFKINPRTGKTQMQENMADEDRRITIAFLDYVNYTKADLEKEVSTALTKNRKKKLTKYTDKKVNNTNGSASVTTKQNVNKGKIKFPSIFGTAVIED